MKTSFKYILFIVLFFYIHSCKKDIDNTIKDIDGNIYTSVTIGTQVWMKENLKTTKYNDGAAIPKITNRIEWGHLKTGAYCDYYNTPSKSAIYGRLYNWYAVDNNEATQWASNKGRNVCPVGWHVPSDSEWTTLITFLGGEGVAGGKLKETGTTHWTMPNTGATNETGFTALSGGYCYADGTYLNIGYFGFWWSSTESSAYEANFRHLYYNSSNVNNSHDWKNCGLSVRCLKD